LNFRHLNDAELANLAKQSEEKLIAYIAEARRAGELELAIRGARVLAYSYEARVRGFVFNKLGSKGPLVAEDIAEVTLADAVASVDSFAGRSMGEFRGWLFTIARRRIVDYMRKDRVDETPLEVDYGEGAEERPATRGQQQTNPMVAIDDSSVFNQAFSELNDAHKLVICLVRFYDLSHKEVAEQVNRHFKGQLDDPMTEQNVNKINSRFDKRLDELLLEADDPSPPDDDD